MNALLLAPYFRSDAIGQETSSWPVEGGGGGGGITVRACRGGITVRAFQTHKRECSEEIESHQGRQRLNSNDPTMLPEGITIPQKNTYIPTVLTQPSLSHGHTSAQKDSGQY